MAGRSASVRNQARAFGVLSFSSVGFISHWMNQVKVTNAMLAGRL
jgi:hypothetical protein